MKPRRCPKCGSGRVIPIIYGLPSRETEVRAREGKVKLGGCIVGFDQPEWHCKNCERSWSKEELRESKGSAPRAELVQGTGPKRWHKGMQHTRGPWTLHTKAWGFEVRHARAGVIAKIKGRSWHTAEPNAYLIKAAPGLFEVLVKIVAHHKISPILREKEARLALEAIAKAQSWDA